MDMVLSRWKEKWENRWSLIRVYDNIKDTKAMLDE